MLSKDDVVTLQAIADIATGPAKRLIQCVIRTIQGEDISLSPVQRMFVTNVIAMGKSQDQAYEITGRFVLDQDDDEQEQMTFRGRMQ